MTLKLSMLLTAGTYVLAQITSAPAASPSSPRAVTTTAVTTTIPNLALPQTKSADMTVFPPTGVTGAGPVTTSGPVGYPGYPSSSAQLGYTIIPGTNRYQPVATTGLTVGGTPPGCGTYRNCLACAQASWYGCAWNPGNGMGPVGCSQTWTPSQCTGIASPTEILAPCSAYLDCASCTNQAGCVFTRAQGCIYSAGPGCLQDPANCINYPAQCPAVGTSPYTLPTYNPTYLYKSAYTGVSSIYGLQMPSTVSTSSYMPYIGASTGVSTALPLSYSAASLSSQLPAYFLPSQPTTFSTPYPITTGATIPTATTTTTTGVYTPQYTGYGTLLPTGTLGNLAGQYYLISSQVPQTTMVPQTSMISQTSVQYVPAGAAPPAGATPLPGYNPATGSAYGPTGAYPTGAYPGTVGAGAGVVYDPNYPLANYGIPPFGVRAADGSSLAPATTTTTSGIQQQTFVGQPSVPTQPQIQYPYTGAVSAVGIRP